jgi:HSP20 family molecular chaperone IbpA
MSEPTASAAQRAPSQNAPVKVVEQQSLSERANQMYEAIARRAFAIFESEGCPHGRDLEHWLKAETELLHPVPVTITETEDALTINAEVPGFSAADLQIGVEPGRLTIGGRKESKEEQRKGKAIYRDQRSSEILRVLSLPALVDASKATATLTNGVVELILPKAAKAQAASGD